ncbi:hypothetical protein WI993_23140, partial [Salmonella enterica subsp. enterica serovar Corvallis]
KRLQPYFDRADRPRVNAWQTLTNDRLGLRDPNDPTYRRPLTQASDLPRDKQQAAEKITAGLMNLMQQGVIRSRQDAAGKLWPDRGAGNEKQHQHCRSGRRPKYPAERNDL